MRICLIGPAPPLRGGIASHTAGLCAALSGQGHAVAVYSYVRLYPSSLFPGRTQHADGVRPLGRAIIDTLGPASWVRVRRLVEASDPELVLVQWWHPLVAPAIASVAKRLSAPVAFLCHNAEPHERVPFIQILSRLALGRASAVLCHSRSVARAVEPLVRPIVPRLCPMPLLADVGADVVTGSDRDHAPTVLFLGHARSYKGLDVLVSAWQMARLPAGSRLWIAGESYLGRGRLQALVRASGRRDSILVEDRYLTDRELCQRLVDADILVAPYRRASQSGIVPLAVAAGLRVVASDAGGLGEQLAGDPRHVLVAPGNAPALAEALGAVLGAQSATDAARQRRVLRTADVRESWLPLVRTCEEVARTERP